MIGALKEAEKEELIKQDLLLKGEISLLLDTYDDIFSDFDPRPFVQRALSDDFLLETKKATLDKDHSLELRLLIPRDVRKFDSEIIIKKRLRDHFKKHAILLENETKKIKKRGAIMAAVGIMMILLAGYILSLSWNDFLKHFLVVLLEPAGWFTAWTGLDEIYYTTRQKKPDFDFYQKMMHADIRFIPY